MTKGKKRHAPELIFPKIQQADRILAEDGDAATVLKELTVNKTTHYRWRNHCGDLKEESAIEEVLA